MTVCNVFGDNRDNFMNALKIFLVLSDVKMVCLINSQWCTVL